MIKKKILIVTSEFPPQPGGIGNHAHNLAKQLSKVGYVVRVIADQRSADGDAEFHFDKGLEYSVQRIDLKTWRLFMYLNRLISLLREVKNNDVVLASGKFSLWSVAFASLFYKRSYIAVIHGTEVNFKQFLLKYSIAKSLSRFNKIIAVSKFTKSLLAKKYKDKTVVITNGYDTSKWTGNPQKFTEIKGSPKLITVGNITERKGQVMVINHLPELIKVYPGIHYHCVGIPTEKEALLKRAVNLGVEKYVTCHGQVEEAKLQYVLKSNDVFVMLSHTTATGDVEGFGIAIIEANALGLPAIGAKGSGVEEAISHGKSGLLIPYDDTRAFIEALGIILGSYTDFKTNAEYWAQEHTWEVIINHYITVLELDDDALD